MSKIENSIGWCDATTNAVTGCAKVSLGCVHCYAEVGMRARVLRAGGDRAYPKGVETWGPGGVRVPVNFEPVFERLNKLMVCDRCHTAHSMDADLSLPCAECGGKHRRIRLFADSNSDWLDPAWPAETLARFLNAIRLAPNVDVLLLTKRIKNFHERLSASLHAEGKLGSHSQWLANWLAGAPPKNVWLGVSVEDQERAYERLPLLALLPAEVRFVSAEPLLERLELFSKLVGPRFDWVIVGGESGPKRRYCTEAALLSVVEQCVLAWVPVYVKQDCARLPGQQGRIPNEIWAKKEFPR